jgi:hypothetical protein
VGVAEPVVEKSQFSGSWEIRRKKVREYIYGVMITDLHPPPKIFGQNFWAKIDLHGPNFLGFTTREAGKIIDWVALRLGQFTELQAIAQTNYIQTKLLSFGQQSNCTL